MLMKGLTLSIPIFCMEQFSGVPVGEAIQREFIQLRDECGLDYKFPFEA